MHLDDLVLNAELDQQQPPDLNNPPRQQPIFQEGVAAIEKQWKRLEDGHRGGEGEEMQPPMGGLGGNRDLEVDGDDEMTLEEDRYTTDQLQIFMGLSLVTGFVFMMLIDQCSGGHSHTHISGKGWLSRCVIMVGGACNIIAQ